MNALKEYTRLWIAIDDLWQQGKGESEEAEAIRDEGDPIWLKLTTEERDAFRVWVAQVDK